MAWTTPKTWATDEVLTAADMNAQLRDNMNYLSALRVYDQTNIDQTVYTTTSATWANVHANLTCVLTPKSTRVLVLAFATTFLSNAAGTGELRLYCTSTAASDTYCSVVTNRALDISMAWVFSSLTPDTEYTFSIQFRETDSATFSVNYAATAVGSWIYAMEV